VLNGLAWLFFMKEKPQMLSGSSDSYVVPNRRLLTQLILVLLPFTVSEQILPGHGYGRLGSKGLINTKR
jgi:hypothetical protein